ncbi:hypothetical protein BDA99DRAFT_543459 [Phascolomyces articulosus]|uniref:Uncharacterized protein n=1 Tax=Phascolomyces articulosus TaxID=60185 RepID=A0AAD5JY11_9FUNG|nr:hypothetical protein BDA99DRAFT_543459 [Phascolomyces articulosus]
MKKHLARYSFPALQQLTLTWSVWEREDEHQEALDQFLEHVLENVTSLTLDNQSHYLDDEILNHIATHARLLEDVQIMKSGEHNFLTPWELQRFLETLTHPEVITRNSYVNELFRHEFKLHHHGEEGFDLMDQFLDYLLEVNRTIDLLYLHFTQELDGIDFAESGRGRSFLQKLNTVSDEFKVKVYRPMSITSYILSGNGNTENYLVKEITHHEYRDTNSVRNNNR